MKWSKLMLVTVVGLLLLCAQADALEWTGTNAIKGVKKVNITGMQFLKIGQGARAAGMGDAFTAVADDISAIFWNGAGLIHVERLAVQANYTKWLTGTDLYSLAAVWNTRSSRSEVLGLSVITQQVEPIGETTIYQPGGTGQTIDVGYVSIGALYGLRFTNKFSFSAKFNYVQETLYTETTRAFTFDVGSFFYTGFRSLRVAMAFRNYGPDQKSRDATFSYLMPLMYNMGVAAEVYGEKGDPAYLTLSAESLFDVGYEQRYLFGAEFWLQNMVALRAGYKHNYDLEKFSLGAGFKQTLAGKTVAIDLSYSMLKERDGVKLFDAPLRLSLSAAF